MINGKKLVQFSLKVIESDYEIPFISNLPTFFFCNRKSAIHNAEFIPSEISDLLKNKDIKKKQYLLLH